MSSKQTPPASAADPAPVGPVPRRLTAAAAVTALQGLALAGLGLYILVMGLVGDPDSARQAETGGLTLLALAALPLVAARGLRLRRRWSRGPALITQLMALPVAWTFFHAGGVAMTAGAVALAVAAVAVFVLLLHPEATEALGIAPAAGDAPLPKK
ncbi:hypothetical protein [Streptomyces sp. NPDC097619]|uniref:hypothetical protein n=1 Tax=Streptomyces sp. NPDC097619 TaxID=3157228 RepID=UPI00332F8138